MAMLVFLVLLFRSAYVYTSCPFDHTAFDDKCLALSFERLSWQQAEAKCETSGGFLVSILSAFEKNAILGKFSDADIWPQNLYYTADPLLHISCRHMSVVSGLRNINLKKKTVKYCNKRSGSVKAEDLKRVVTSLYFQT